MKLSMKKVESKHEKSLFRQYFGVLAYAEHYRFWPPPLFIITITILQIIFFAMHFAYYGSDVSVSQNLGSGRVWSKSIVQVMSKI